MNVNRCPQCGASIGVGEVECRYCGERFSPNATQQTWQPQSQQSQGQQAGFTNGATYTGAGSQGLPQIVIQQNFGGGPTAPGVGYGYGYGAYPMWPQKSKLAAILLAFFLGGLGAHWFYLGRSGKGVLYFCLLFVGGLSILLAFIDTIVFILTDRERFEMKYQVRLS